jgi:hypothetical protein
MFVPYFIDLNVGVFTHHGITLLFTLVPLTVYFVLFILKKVNKSLHK